METPLLHQIRHARGFSRSVAYLIVIALVGLVLERILYYTLQDNDIIEEENVVERINRLAPHKARQLNKQLGLVGNPQQREPSTDAQLSQSLQAIQTNLAVLASADKDQHAKANEQLQTLRTTLHQLDKTARDDFAKIKQHIENKNLPDVIQQRHAAAVNTYQQEMSQLLAGLAAIDIEANPDTRAELIQALNQQLAEQQFKRRLQPFDPNQLPNRSLQPDDTNQPKQHKADYAAAGLYNTPLPQYAALGDFTYGDLPGASNPAYLGESDEVKLTPAIHAQAAALNHDPVQIYHWVRNNIQWIPSWGAIQDADITLGSQRGNAFDIASLHIALLRASQIPARYVHGTIDVPIDQFKNWAGGFTDAQAAGHYAASGGIPLVGVIEGGQIIKYRLEHIWVEAASDYHPSRGSRNLNADSWIQLDPSYKQYEHLTGLDVASITGIDGDALATDFLASGTVNESEGWISGFDPAVLQSAQANAQTVLQDHINTNLPNATVGDVIGGKKIIEQTAPGLPSSLPNAIKVKGASYASIPSTLQASVTITLGRDSLNQPTGQITLPWATVNNHKLTLSYQPATAEDEATLQSYLPEGDITDISQLPNSLPGYLINVIPQLKLDGDIISQGQPLALGQELNLEYTMSLPTHGSRSFSSPVIAGSYQVLMTVGGSVSVNTVNELSSRISTTRSVLESGNNLEISKIDRDILLGDLFYLGNLAYHSEFMMLSKLTGMQINSKTGILPSIGTFGYVPNVDYLFGLPKAIKSGGVEIDIDNLSTFTGVGNGDKSTRVYQIQQSGLISSMLEHAIPEKIFIVDPSDPPQGISAIKAITIAQSQGQKIYKITENNYVNILPMLSHDSSTIREIHQSVEQGKIVLTHTSSVSVPGWSGAGYIIIDADTGEGAYKISGGQNGGWLILLVFFILAILIIAALITGQFMIAALLAWQYWSFAQKVNYIAKNVPADQAYQELKNAVFLTAVGTTLTFVPLAGTVKELGAGTVGALSFLSFFTGLWGLAWYKE